MIIDDHYIVICFGADLNWMDGNYRNCECWLDGRVCWLVSVSV